MRAIASWIAGLTNIMAFTLGPVKAQEYLAKEPQKPLGSVVSLPLVTIRIGQERSVRCS